jgi:hypothetical protein
MSLTAVVQIATLESTANGEEGMRYRTITKFPDTGRLDRAEVRAAIQAARERRYEPRAGYGALMLRETPRDRYGERPHGGAR